MKEAPKTFAELGDEGEENFGLLGMGRPQPKLPRAPWYDPLHCCGDYAESPQDEQDLDAFKSMIHDFNTACDPAPVILNAYVTQVRVEIVRNIGRVELQNEPCVRDRSVFMPHCICDSVKILFFSTVILVGAPVENHPRRGRRNEHIARAFLSYSFREVLDIPIN